MVIEGLPDAKSAQRFDVLDALRGICALLVALYHFRSNGTVSSLPFVQNGWLFVDYFFVLSGFVIAHSYRDRIASGTASIGRFMALRLGRIYPLHLAVLLAFVAMELVLVAGGDALAQYVPREPFSGSRTFESLIQSLFLVQAFGLPGAHGWNIPAWSIAAEVWTYLLFAFVFLIGKRFIPALSAAFAIIALIWMMSYSRDLHITFDGGVLRCILGFGLGVVTHHIFLRFGGIGGSLWEVFSVAVTLAFVSMASGMATFAAPFLFAAMIFILASQRGVVSHILRHRSFQWLGLVSYSIYLVHPFVQGRLGEILELTGIVDNRVGRMGRTILEGTPLQADLVTAAMLILVIAASGVTYYLIEKPGRELSRHLILGKQSAAEA